jgi:hypothetical protein
MARVDLGCASPQKGVAYTTGMTASSMGMSSRSRLFCGTAKTSEKLNKSHAMWQTSRMGVSSRGVVLSYLLPMVAVPHYPRSGTIHLGEPQCYALMRLLAARWARGKNERLLLILMIAYA